MQQRTSGIHTLEGDIVQTLKISEVADRTHAKTFSFTSECLLLLLLFAILILL